MIHGLDNWDPTSKSELDDLKEKLKNLNLDLVGDLLGDFIKLLEKMYNGKINPQEKSETAASIFKIISTLRTFETLMNLELIKKELLHK